MIEIQRDTGVPYVVLTGEFDLANVADLESSLAGCSIEALVFVDLTAVTFVDSTILGALVRRYKRSNGNLIVILPQDSKIRRVFDVTNLTEYLRIVPARKLGSNDSSR